MATRTLKVLGQSAPSAATNTDLYTVPASTQVVLSGVFVTNRAGATVTCRVAIRPNGAAIANQHYIAYDVAVAAGGAVVIGRGVTIDAADVVTVYNTTADLSFTVCGQEVT